MKLDKQGRARIPKDLFSLAGLSNTTQQLKIYIPDQKTIILHNDNELISRLKCFGYVKLDSKGRFTVPKDIRDYIKLENYIVFVQNNRIVFHWYN